MTDKQILERIGLSDEEATEVCHKVAGFNTAQARAITGATPDRDAAAAAIGPDCAPEDLQRFIDKRKGHHPSASQIYFAPQDEC